ncbi:hypothetical protein BN1708_002750 [Verticillium longisporum]|uniref:RING-type domain-containing protein n=1 Tax=Verticillium longisporum TaxID=100787 RepID=A0A0G4L0H0_VERLO|nr:hypothetical protein BN1708_002750 [Verticillium longisporum]
MAASSPEASLFVGSDEYDLSPYDGHVSLDSLDSDEDLRIMADAGDSPAALPPIFLDHMFRDDNDPDFEPELLGDDMESSETHSLSPSNHSYQSVAEGSLPPYSSGPEALDLQNRRADPRDVALARDMALGVFGDDLDWMSEIDSNFDFAEIEGLEAELEAQNPHIRQPLHASQGATSQGSGADQGGRAVGNLLRLLENGDGRASDASGARRPAPGPPNRNAAQRPFSPIHLLSSEGDEYPGRDSFRSRHARDVLVDVELDARHHAPPALQRQGSRQSGAAEVIDLTNEPDSPIQAHARPVSQNVRRQNSQARNPPAFARSDSSILGGPPVIDLTDDAPDRPLPPLLPGTRWPQASRRAVHSPELLFLNQRPIPRQQQPNRREGVQSRARSRQANMLNGLRRNFLHHLPFLNLFNPDPADGNLDMVEGMMGNPFNPVGHIQLQYQRSAFDQRPPSPKPVHVPPPAARSGFSRDTKADNSSAFVCPACNEELAYDPLEAPSAPAPQASRSTRLGKRPRSEHHFWALKGCGHVYCEDCYENRKPTNKRPNTGFLHAGRDHKLSCAVEGCDTQVTNKGSWVGIYL